MIKSLSQTSAELRGIRLWARLPLICKWNLSCKLNRVLGLRNHLTLKIRRFDFCMKRSALKMGEEKHWNHVLPSATDKQALFCLYEQWIVPDQVCLLCHVQSGRVQSFWVLWGFALLQKEWKSMWEWDLLQKMRLQAVWALWIATKLLFYHASKCLSSVGDYYKGSRDLIANSQRIAWRLRSLTDFATIISAIALSHICARPVSPWLQLQLNKPVICVNTRTMLCFLS